MKVLVIEDSERLRRSLEHGLRRSGFAVDSVADGEEGLAYAKHGVYDVVVLDRNLGPDERGIRRRDLGEVARREGEGLHLGRGPLFHLRVP